MAEYSSLLTVIVESQGQLDRESTMYRRLISARLRWESDFSIQVVHEQLTTARIAELSATLESKYVIFMRASHQLSPAYMTTMIEYLRSRTVYMAEPVVYVGNLPKNIAGTKINQDYYYARDTDVYGIAFNTRRLSDALDAFADLDRTSLYIAFRLYWSLAALKPLTVGYSVASATKAAIGIQTPTTITRLLPLIGSGSAELRVYILRQLVLFLRGMRQQKRTMVNLNHLRELIRIFDLGKYVSLADPLHPFEGSWVRWLKEPAQEKYLFKQLSEGDNYLVFQEDTEKSSDRINLYQLDFGGDTLRISKTYLPREIRPAHSRAASYDFYSRPIRPSSTLLFFDRPMQADDNAEHLYEYFTKHHPDYSEAYFALNPKSRDWPRLEAKGFKLIPIFTPAFYEKFLISDLVISSQIYNLRYRGKTLANSRFVYLQHGVQLNDMTDWVLSKYFDVFVATGKLEADYLGQLAPRETLNSGIPRFESLARMDKEEKHILFMPTWRFNLHNASAEHFEESDFFRSINNILTDPKLLEFLKRTQRTLRVQLHPNIAQRAELFSFSDRVMKSEMSYSQAIADAELVFTDYSSVVLDAAFIRTPIAYYQWDAEDFFEEQPYESRLDYRTEGLGPLFTKHDELIEHIVSERFRDIDPEFEKRRGRFFEGVDPHRINATIVERMLSL